MTLPGIKIPRVLTTKNFNNETEPFKDRTLYSYDAYKKKLTLHTPLHITPRFMKK